MGIQGWANYKLGDLVAFQRGHDLPVSQTTAGPYPVVGSNGIIAYHKSYTTKKPCITVGRSGNSVGVVHYYDCNCWAHNTTLYIKEFKKNVHPKFLYYYIKTLHLDYYGGGSAVPTLNRNHIHPIEVYVPVKHEEQRAIAHILSSLDKKIELNNRINKILEEMAQIIFKSWFVDFEPFKDGEFEDSELGRIPKGWKAGTICDLGEVVGGSTPSKKNPSYYTEKGIPWITPKDLSDNKHKYISRGAIDITEEGYKNSSTRIMPKGTVLFSSRAPIGYVAVAKNGVTTNQGFKSIVPKDYIGTEYIYYFLKFNTELIENRASGSTFKEISGSEMKRIPALIPDNETLANFNRVADALGEQMRKGEEENDILINIRDTLLPKLISGEIRVPIDIPGKEAD